MKYLLLFSILSAVLCINVQSVGSDGVFSFNISRINNQNKRNFGRICQNNRTKCTDKQTCCKKKHNNYHCCQYSNAVCCPGKYYCCPAGTTCDIKNKKCINSTIILRAFKHNKEIEKLQSTRPVEIEIYNFSFVKNTLGKGCLNEKYRCPGKKRCCELYNGNFGCCPFNQGVCCPDLKTCCPHQTVCDGVNKKCSADSLQLIPFSVKDQRKTKRLGTVVCPDNVTECFSWETCCPIENNGYGCCPLENATCCADKTTCCRQNQKCDVKNGRCLKLVKSKIERNENKTNRKLLISFPGVLKINNYGSTDRYCPSSHKLCGFDSMQNHCCPYTSGVCCSDSQSCCPEGTRCIINGCA